MDELSLLKAELAQSKQEYEDLFEYNSSAYLMIDSTYTIQSLNFQASHMLGLKRELILNQLFFNYITLNSKKVLHEKINALLATKSKQNCQITLLILGGKKKFTFVECSILRNNLICLCLTEDLLNYQLQEHNVQLKKSLNLIENLFQRASDALAALDENFNLKIANELFYELFFKIFPCILNEGMNLIDALANFPDLKLKISNACQQAIEGHKKKIIIEYPLSTSESYYCYELCIFSIYNSEGQKEIIFRIKNLTEYRKEEKIRHKQQLEIGLSSRTSAMGEMASALAHEINQPLTVISTYSRSCLHLINNADIEIKNKLLIPLQKIASQAELAGEIIHNMKNLIREGNFVMEETRINQLIQDTISIFHYEIFNLNLKINLNLMDDLPEIMSNKIHLMQVLLNLMRNSVEALRGAITPNPELSIETTFSDNVISIHIRDNGPGIPEELRNKILNNYYTTKRQGTGIGLRICRTLIEEHGGRLILQVHQQPGAWFTINLPHS